MFDKLKYAESYILKTYNDYAKIGAKAVPLRKIGRNPDLDAGVEELLWGYGGIETLPTTNVIDTISSSAGDAQTVIIEGHTVSGGVFTPVTQTATLVNTSKVPLTTPLARVSRVYNTGTTDFAGTIYVYEDDTTTTPGIPDTAAKVHLVAITSDNQSFKAAVTISNSDYWIITQAHFSADRVTAGNVDFDVQVREAGSVFRTVLPFSVGSGTGTVVKDLDIPIIVRPNSDVRVMGTSSAANMVADVMLEGYLAVKITGA